VSREKEKKRSDELTSIRLDETTNLLVQLLNLLLEGVSKDKMQMRADIKEEFNRLISSLVLYADLKCLDAGHRMMLRNYLMRDAVLSHMEAEESERRENWLKLSGKTVAMILDALAMCGRPSKISIRRESEGGGLRVEKI